MKTPQQKREKKVRAWIVTDGSKKPIAASSGVGRTLTELFFVYQTEKAAFDSWQGMNIIPCTISFSLPLPKKKKAI